MNSEECNYIKIIKVVGTFRLFQLLFLDENNFNKNY